MPANDFPIGTRVRIMMGRRKRYGTVTGSRFVASMSTLEARVLVRVDGKEKLYLPNSLRVVEAKCEP